jgi:hypothetical protein
MLGEESGNSAFDHLAEPPGAMAYTGHQSRLCSSARIEGVGHHWESGDSTDCGTKEVLGPNDPPLTHSNQQREKDRIPDSIRRADFDRPVDTPARAFGDSLTTWVVRPYKKCSNASPRARQ